MNTPFAVLNKPIIRNARTLRYQEALDRKIDGYRKTWDLDRGLLGTRGLKLPHETVEGYWGLPEEDKKRVTPPEIARLYQCQSGREGTSKLCEAAFCWHSPLSRHRGDRDLLRFFESGLRFFADSIRDDGLMGVFGFNGLGWAHGWDIEGLVYGMEFCGKDLDPSLAALVRRKFALSARRHATLDQRPEQIGSYGNQRSVFALGLLLYGRLLGDSSLLEQAERHWQDLLPKVLDESGQAIEQCGPCMHYSYTSFFYAWLNLALRGDTSCQDRLLRCLDWFRLRHTENLTPIAGPSARMYYEAMPSIVCDLWPAAEQLSHADASLREFVDRAARKAARGDEAETCVQASYHGASVLVWAILMAQQDSPTAKGARAREARIDRFYERTHLLKRSPLQYVLVRRRYQTHFNFTDYLPFSGIQTWALGDEPPIVHPTPLFPSTTQAWGLDTARQGTSHNWGLYGAGAMALDRFVREAAADDEISFLIARYDLLWRLAFFTDLSTVILEFGRCGPRRTSWTLNRLEPSEPQIGEGIVRFLGRKGCLHSHPAPRPQLIPSSLDHEQARGVRQLVYECGEGPAVFGFSDDSLQLPCGRLLVDHELRFSDAAGRYEITLHEGFFRDDNPGNCSIDIWQLAHHGTTAKCVA